MIAIVVMVVAAIAVVAFLLLLGAITGRSGGANRCAGSGDGGYVASSDTFGDSGHCHTGDFGGGDCGGGGD